MSLALPLIAGIAFGTPTHHVAAATTFTVNTTGDGADIYPGDGVCDALPNQAPYPQGEQCSLRAAIMETNALKGPDTINLPFGTYKLLIPGMDDTTAATGDLDILDALVIQGQGRAKTIVDGNAMDRVFQIGSNTTFDVELRNLTIQNGKIAAGGGGIFNYGPNLTLSSVNLINNEAQDGGGIVVTRGSLKLVNSLVEKNKALTPGKSGYGGGIYMYPGTSALLQTTIVQGNLGGYGGGIVSDGALDIASSTINANIASTGAGVLSNGRLTMTHSTVSGNQATLDSSSSGGGIVFGYSSQGSSLIHVTIAANKASTVGGGIFMQEDYLEPKISRSIIADNVATEAPNCFGAVRASGYNLWGKILGCEMVGGDGPEQLNKIPLLGPLAYNGGATPTHALIGGSPAIDAGPAACPAIDQRGAPRPADGNGDGKVMCDIGAYEYNGPVISSVSPTKRTAGSGAFTLTVTGKQFTTKSQVTWKGVPRVTQFVNSTTLKAQITADDTKMAQEAGVRVVTPGAIAASGTSNKLIVTITP